MQPWENDKRRERSRMSGVVDSIAISVIACTIIYGSLILKAFKTNRNKKGNK